MELVSSSSAAAAQTTSQQLPPGFRFHPTDEELILHYLRNRAASMPCPVPIIADVDIYKFDPWDLPCKAVYGSDGEWYFFTPRDRKYPNGIRPNRAAGSGYWKATGTDKPVHDTAAGGGSVLGVKKALVFYTGRPPKGTKTNWVMHEYRLAAAAAAFRPPVKFRNVVSMRLDDWVLCRIYKKQAGQASSASPMVPPLADYDHLMDNEDEHTAGGGSDDICSSFHAPMTTRSSGTKNTTTKSVTTHQQLLVAAPPRLPKIPSISDLLLDDYALAQIFDTAAVPPDDADQLAMHPSLNQLLAVGGGDDSAHSWEPELQTYSSSYPAAGSAGGVAKRKVNNPDECVSDDAGNLLPTAKRLHVSWCFDDAPQPASGSAATSTLHCSRCWAA